MLDFTSRTAGNLSFDWAAIDNSGTRPTSLRVFWSTNGTTFTEITGAQLLDKESGGSPSSGGISIALPSALDGISTARLRFYNHAGTTSTGSGDRDKMEIDNISITSTAPTNTPTVPTITTIAPTNTQLSVAFTAPVSDGGSAITNYEYSTNGGSSFTACSPTQTTSPIIITGLTNGVSYNVQIRAINANGNGAATSTYAATPYTTPAAQASITSFASINTTSYTINFAAGTGGSGRLVVVRPNAAVDFTPVDGAYTANTNFTAGTGVGPSSDNKIVYVGSGTAVSITNLTANTEYHVAIFEYNGSGVYTYYLTPGATGSRTTLANEPTASSGTPTFASTTTNSFTVNWTAASPVPDGYLVVRDVATTPTSPTDGVSYSVSDAIGSSTVVYVGTGLTVPQTSLSAGTEYRFRVFSFNGASGSNNYRLISVSNGVNFTLSSEPTAHPASLAASATSATSIALTYSAANTITNAGGYLILSKQGSAPTGLPTDATNYSVGNTIGDATVAAIETASSGTSTNITSLSAQTNYHYAIIPFSWDGTNTETRNYYTVSTVVTANATTVSNLSDVVAVVASSPATISSLINDAAPLTSSTGVQVWQVTIRDGGSGLNDLDVLPTKVSAITFTTAAGNSVAWNTAIKTAALFDGTTFIATASNITATTIEFTGLNISVGDNSTKTLSLRISLNETLGSGNDDGDDFVFQLSNGNFTTVSDGTSSEKTNFTAFTTTNDIENVIAVVATKLNFVLQPSNATIGVAVTPSITINATDVNNNLDVNFASNVTLNVSTGTTTIHPSATKTIAAISGLATFNNLYFNTSAIGNTLIGSSSGLTSTTASSSFDITSNPTAGLQLAAANTSYLIDFDNTVSGVNNGGWAGTGFSPTPSAGQLNSNAWAVTGWSNGNLAFGGTQTTASTDYTRGTSSIAVTTGGLYNFEISGNKTLGIQPGGSDWAPGTVTLKIQNATGNDITALNIAYKVYIRNDQDRSSSFNFSYSNNDVTYTAVTDLSITSPTALDALGWKMYYCVVKITGMSIPATGYYYLMWSGADVAGSVSRDEFALDDIEIIPNPTGLLSSAGGDILNAVIAGEASFTSNVTGLTSLLVTTTGNLTTTDKTIAFNTSASATINGVLNTANLDGFSGSATTTIVNTNSPTITLGASSTIVYNGSGAQTLSSRTDYKNLTINNAAGLTATGNSTINGSLTLTNGTLALGANTLTFACTAATRSLGLIDASTGTLNFTNSSLLNIPASLFTSTVNNFTSNSTGGIRLDSNITIAGNLSLLANNLDANNMLSLASTGSVIHNGGTISNFIIPTTLTNYVLPNGTTSLTSNLNILGDLTLAGNILDIAASTIVVSGNISRTTGTIRTNGGTITLSGAGSTSLFFDQTTPGTTNKLNNLNINRTAETITIGNAVLISENGTVTVTAGELASGGNLTLLSTGNTGRIAELTAGASVTGNVTVQRWINGGSVLSLNRPGIPQLRTWRAMSSPISGGTYAQFSDDILISGPGGIGNGFDFAGPTSSIRLWQETGTRGWASIATIGTSLPSSGIGMLVFYRGTRDQTSSLTNTSIAPNDNVIDFEGTINSGDVVVNLDYQNTPTPADDGWNLVGNPYPSQINWANVSKDAGVDDFFYIYDPASGNYFSEVTPNTGIIATGQAFFVQVNTSGQKITFQENDKSANGYTSRFKTGNNLIKVKMQFDSVQFDLATLNFSANASNNYIFKEDASKLANSIYNIAFVTPNNRTVQHNFVSNLSNNSTDTFVLQTTSTINNTFSLNFSDFAAVPSNKNIILVDKHNNNSVDLRSTSNYAFTINNAIPTTFGDRFLLIITDQFNPVPVKIISFTGKKINQVNLLSWVTVSEKNIISYEVQLSEDGIGFSTIGLLKAINSSNKTNYSFTDNTPKKHSASYYRLKINEANTTSYTNTIVIIEGTEQVASTMIYPNPAKDFITILTNQQAEIKQVIILNMQGLVLLNIKNPTTKINISDLPRGIYLVKIDIGEGIKSIKLIVN